MTGRDGGDYEILIGRLGEMEGQVGDCGRYGVTVGQME